MKEPSNETYLSAELCLVLQQPVKAARLAQELCRIGRRYLSLSERIRNEPDPEEKLVKARQKAHDRATKAISETLGTVCKGVDPEPIWVEQSDGGLHLVCHSETRELACSTVLL